MANASTIFDEKSGKRRMKSVEERYTRGVKIQTVIRFVVCLIIVHLDRKILCKFIPFILWNTYIYLF